MYCKTDISCHIGSGCPGCFVSCLSEFRKILSAVSACHGQCRQSLAIFYNQKLNLGRSRCLKADVLRFGCDFICFPYKRERGHVDISDCYIVRNKFLYLILCECDCSLIGIVKFGINHYLNPFLVVEFRRQVEALFLPFRFFRTLVGADQFRFDAVRFGVKFDLALPGYGIKGNLYSCGRNTFG